MTNHPITPPPKLVQQWYDSILNNARNWQQQLVAQAAQWGADMELKACCEWLDTYVPRYCEWSANFRTFRRPKPPSLRKQAYDALDTYIYGEPDPKDKERTYNTIRRALETLND